MSIYLPLSKYLITNLSQCTVAANNPLITLTVYTFNSPFDSKTKLTFYISAGVQGKKSFVDSLSLSHTRAHTHTHTHTHTMSEIAPKLTINPVCF